MPEFNPDFLLSLMKILLVAVFMLAVFLATKGEGRTFTVGCAAIAACACVGLALTADGL